jgi:hypothetical protein
MASENSRLMKKILLNLAVFQIGWMVCVLGGDIYALAYTLGAVLIHQFFLVEHKSEWLFITIVTVVGCLWDSLMALSGVMIYADATAIGIPVWLMCLWVLFAMTFMHALAWLRRYLWLAAAFAGIFGPLSYWVGDELSTANVGAPLIGSLAIMALGWAVLFPAGMYLTSRFKSSV